MPNRTSEKLFTEAWAISSKGLRSLNQDAEFWWQATEPALAVIFSQAGYNTHAQSSSLLFHRQMIIPSLGPRPSAQRAPHEWGRGFMTDGFSPLEYSWS